MAETNPFSDEPLGWHWVDKWGAYALYQPDRWSAAAEIIRFFPDVGDPQWFAKVYTPGASVINQFDDFEVAKAWALTIARIEK